MFRWRSRRKIHLTLTKKVPERSGKTEASTDVCVSSFVASYVWEPGAGVVAAGRLCPRLKKTGVASRP